jgi:hypothetical protein
MKNLIFQNKTPLQIISPTKLRFCLLLLFNSSQRSKILRLFCTLLLLSFSRTFLSAQEVYECGTIIKRTIPAEPKFIDRFGNLYSEAELTPPPKSIGDSVCQQLTKFDLTFSTGFSDYEKQTICDVFYYIENEIILNVPNVKAKIAINKKKLEPGVLGDATGYYPFDDCGIGQTSIFLTMLGVTHYEKNIVGTININSDFNGEWHHPIYDSNPQLVSWLDLYSVVLHEALHIIGFSTRIDPIDKKATVLSSGSNFANWDKFLYNKSTGNKLIIGASTEKCCQHFEYNPNEVNTDFTKFCDSQIWFKGGSGDIAPISCHDKTGNTLSHLSILCASGSQFVMNRNIPPNTKRRKITKEESEIICNLGYLTLPLNCEPTNLVAVDDCDPIIYILSGTGSFNVLVNDIIPNNITATIVSFSSAGLTNVVMNNGVITYNVFARGEWTIRYKIVNNDTKECDEATLRIVCIADDLGSCCAKDECILSCLGDFEDFTSNFELRYYVTHVTDYCPENPFLINFANAVNTVDLLGKGTTYLDYCDGNKIHKVLQSVAPHSGKNHLGFWSGDSDLSEGFAIPLCKKIKKGTKFHLDFWARVDEQCLSQKPSIKFSFINKFPSSKAVAMHSTSQLVPIDDSSYR